MADRAPLCLKGGVIANRRSPGEAVIVLWMTPTSVPTQPCDPKLERYVVVAAAHMSRNVEERIDFGRGAYSPGLTGPGGLPAFRIEASARSPEILDVIERIKERLKSGAVASTPGDSTVLAGLADRLEFHVFDKGAATVGPGWMVAFAGRQYELEAPQR